MSDAIRIVIAADVTDKEVRDERILYVAHGEPLICSGDLWTVREDGTVARPES